MIAFRMAVVVLLLILLAAPSSAQIEVKPGIGIGFTDWSKEPAGTEIKGKVGFLAGGTLAFGEERFYGEGGVFYTRQSTEVVSTAGNVKVTNSIDGLRIPAALGFRLLGEEKAMFDLRVFGGASAFIVTKVDAQGASKDDFTSPTWGVFAGAGADILMFYLDLKYEWSLSDVSKLSTVDVGKSRSFYAVAGVRLPL